MNIPSPKSLLVGAVRAGLALAFAVSAQALSAQTVLIQDSFTLNGTTRVEEGSLNGTEPDTSLGGGTWIVTNGAPTVFTSSGAVGTNGSTQAEARIPIGQLAASTTVSATVVVGDTTGGTEWVSVGFLKNTTNTNWFSANASALWVMIRPTGNWTVFANGSSVTVASGIVSDFSATASYTLGLTYDPDSSMVSAFLTSSAGTTTTLYSGSVSGTVNGASISVAGLRINSSSTTASIDDFQVTSAASIPEPGTAALVVGMLTAGIAVERRRAR